MTEISLVAPIVPGCSAAGLTIGESFHGKFWKSRKRLPDGSTVITYPSVRVWIREGCIEQITVGHGYGGLLGQSIRVGSTLGDLIDRYGCLMFDEWDEIVLCDVSGVCFEVGPFYADKAYSDIEDMIEKNRDHRILEISVYCPEEEGEEEGGHPSIAHAETDLEVR